MKILSKVYFGLFVASLLLGWYQNTFYDEFFLKWISPSVIFIEGVLLWFLTKKILYPLCLCLSASLHLMLFFKVDVSSFGVSLVLLEFFRVFDVLGFISYRRSRKKRMAKPSSLEINTRIGGAVIPGLLAILLFVTIFSLKGSEAMINILLFPIAIGLVIITLGQWISLFKDCRVKQPLSEEKRE